MNNLWRGPSIDASYQVSLHLAEWFKRRRLKCEKLTDDIRRTPSDGKSSHCLWQGELKTMILPRTKYLLRNVCMLLSMGEKANLGAVVFLKLYYPEPNLFEECVCELLSMEEKANLGVIVFFLNYIISYIDREKCLGVSAYCYSICI